MYLRSFNAAENSALNIHFPPQPVEDYPLSVGDIADHTTLEL